MRSRRRVSPCGWSATSFSLESLSLSSDFTAFLKEEVSEALRRKALHKLFSDPHFNQMDGLDIYIDDYSQPDPIPPEILAKLQHAREWLMDDATAQPTRDGEPALTPDEAGPMSAEPCGRVQGGDGAEPEVADALPGRHAPAADLSATDSSTERASPEGGNASGS